MNIAGTISLISQKENEMGTLLKNALENGAEDRRAWKALDIIRGVDSYLLLSVNSKAQIQWATIFSEAVFDFFGLADDEIYPKEPVFLVTLVDNSMITNSLAQELDTKKMKDSLGARLRGLNYIGMIEPAFYNTLYDKNGNPVRNMVSWHGHFLVWGIKRRFLRRHIKRLNTHLRAIMPQYKAAHWKEIEGNQFGHKLWYINKMPCKEYSVGKRRKPDEKTRKPRYKHNSRKIRPGTAVKLFHLMKPLYLDELALAGGEGKAILHEIKTKALAPYRERHGWREQRP